LGDCHALLQGWLWRNFTLHFNLLLGFGRLAAVSNAGCSIEIAETWEARVELWRLFNT
jgi:hypothetical protein